MKRLMLIGMAGFLILFFAPLASFAKNPVQIDILYMNHGPMQPTLRDLKTLLPSYKDTATGPWSISPVLLPGLPFLSPSAPWPQHTVRQPGSPLKTWGPTSLSSGGQAVWKTAASMRGILLPFSNQVFEPGELFALKQLPGENANALLLWEFTSRGFRTIMGVDAGQPALGAVKVKEWVKEGRFPQNSDEIALEKHFAKFQKSAIGDIFQLGEKTFTVTGLIEIKEGPQVAAANIYTTLDSARALFKGKPDAVNLFYLKLEDPARLNSIKSEILFLKLSLHFHTTSLGIEPGRPGHGRAH